MESVPKKGGSTPVSFQQVFNEYIDGIIIAVGPKIWLFFYHVTAVL